MLLLLMLHESLHDKNEVHADDQLIKDLKQYLL